MEDHLPVMHVVTNEGSEVLSSGEETEKSSFVILKSSLRFCLIVGTD